MIVWGPGQSPHPPNTSQTCSSGQKNEIYSRGRRFEADFSDTNFFLASEPPPGHRLKGGGGGGRVLPHALTLPPGHSPTTTPAPTAFPTAGNRPQPLSQSPPPTAVRLLWNSAHSPPPPQANPWPPPPGGGGVSLSNGRVRHDVSPGRPFPRCLRRSRWSAEDGGRNPPAGGGPPTASRTPPVNFSPAGDPGLGGLCAKAHHWAHEGGADFHLRGRNHLRGPKRAQLTAPTPKSYRD